MKLSDFKPGDLVSFHTGGTWVDGTVHSRCEKEAGVFSVTVTSTCKIMWRVMHKDENIGTLIKRRYLYAIGEEVQVEERHWNPHDNRVPRIVWVDTRVTGHPNKNDGVNVARTYGGETFFPYSCIRKKPVETEQERIDRATKPLHAEIERLSVAYTYADSEMRRMRDALEESAKDLAHRTESLQDTLKDLAVVRMERDAAYRLAAENEERADKNDKERQDALVAQRGTAAHVKLLEAALFTTKQDLKCARAALEDEASWSARLRNEAKTLMGQRDVLEADRDAFVKQCETARERIRVLEADLLFVGKERDAVLADHEKTKEYVTALMNGKGWEDMRTERDIAYREVDRLKKEWNDMRKERDQAIANATRLKNDYVRAVSEHGIALADLAQMTEHRDSLYRAWTDACAQRDTARDGTWASVEIMSLRSQIVGLDKDRITERDRADKNHAEVQRLLNKVIPGFDNSISDLNQTIAKLEKKLWVVKNGLDDLRETM